MSVEVLTAREATAPAAEPVSAAPVSAGSAGSAARDGSAVGARGRRRLATASSEDSRLAVEIRSLVERSKMDEARERFAELVVLHQRRASRIAYQYLRDVFDADEAVQDAFVKVFSHITSYRETWPFEVWFTRILINGCLDRRKARARRDRWFVSAMPAPGVLPDETRALIDNPADVNPEQRLLGRERRAAPRGGNRPPRRPTADGVHAVPLRRLHAREVSAMTGLNESTVRVHLFRAARKLRVLLGGKA